MSVRTIWTTAKNLRPGDWLVMEHAEVDSITLHIWLAGEGIYEIQLKGGVIIPSVWAADRFQVEREYQ